MNKNETVWNWTCLMMTLQSDIVRLRLRCERTACRNSDRLSSPDRSLSNTSQTTVTTAGGAWWNKCRVLLCEGGKGMHLRSQNMAESCQKWCHKIQQDPKGAPCPCQHIFNAQLWKCVTMEMRGNVTLKAARTLPNLTWIIDANKRAGTANKSYHHAPRKRLPNCTSKKLRISPFLEVHEQLAGQTIDLLSPIWVNHDSQLSCSKSLLYDCSFLLHGQLFYALLTLSWPSNLWSLMGCH